MIIRNKLTSWITAKLLVLTDTDREPDRVFGNGDFTARAAGVTGGISQRRKHQACRGGAANNG